jgi:GH15 family glucan-1,4-alpha-glucosidase
VRLGNNAGAQLQLGGWGDLIETVWTYVRHGHSISPEAGERLGDMGQLLCQIWTREDAGLWELGQRAHYTTSKIGCWVALDRLLELSAGGHVPDRHAAHWRRQRDEIARFIDSRLYSAARGSYLMEAQGKLDCGTLLAARRGYGDPRGARLRGTIEAIRAELHAEGPLFYRYSGMQEEENAFLACSFWLVEALALSGQLDAAGELMGDAVSLGNDVGLLSEEMEPGSRALRGNFPQALTHLSLISAAAILASCQDGGSAPEIHAVRSGASG